MSTLRVVRDSETIWRAEVCGGKSLNAIDFDVMHGFELLLDELESSEHIRVFVLSGEGTRSFISGGDLKAFSSLTTEEDARIMSERMKSILKRIELLPCWTVAHINGDAYGGGCETMAAFDFRYTHQAVKLGWTQARFGLTPGWGGLTRLIELVGQSTALLWLAQAKVVDAQTAHMAGFINHVAPNAIQLKLDVDALCVTLARQERVFIDALKTGARHLKTHGRTSSIDAELSAFSKLWASPIHHQRVAAFLRAPQKEST